ncbi:CDC42 rho GTPase-activating protein [Neolentinus lepideus HHB14362 ss-1]|uniref:CDC42 rho GTPase-activating protein n=1 Tax=Neolentinus lepideus HHB14362 ss-1 TaxID=1314782 RepID=A0A165R7J4_9AGAM|nr:CDC42 rho GTPase-activating protein [Neolentinus lepideus HHB14362 ss-1]
MPPPTLSLKQRLTALSLSSSSPSSPNEATMSPKSPKRRPLLNAPWTKRFNTTTIRPEQTNHDRLQEVMNRVIFQAGVDYETRPMVVLNASALPDPQEVSYDLLLSRVLAYLNLYVESDYTVVFFAAGSKHTPGWNWVWKAYRGLSRKYRKNLKRLYIVHSTFFSKMLFSLAGAIVSPKFFRKITYINTLSDLAYQVPITQIDIPPSVYQENLKHEREVKLPIPTRADLFGVPLEELMGFDGEKGGIPRVVKDCIQYLRENGLEEDGLFRRSPNSVLLRQVKEAYDRGHVVSLETFDDPHLAAVLLKKYLRDLPDAVFPESIYPLVRRCPIATSDPADVSDVDYIRETLLPELPHCAYILLSHVFHLLNEVSLRAASNRMDAHNLAVVITPNLVKGSNPIRDVMMCGVPNGPTLYDPTPAPTTNPAALSEGRATLGLVVKICIQRYYEVFDEVVDRSEAIPPQQPLGDSTASSSASGSPLPSPLPPDIRPKSQEFGDDEDIDDEMLIMPIGPSGSQSAGMSSSPPTAWNAGGGFKPRHKNTMSRGSNGSRSMHTIMAPNGTVSGSSSAYGTMKAKSMISIEKGGNGTTTTGRKGSISVGRGTMRKSAGSGVEALSITAAGFFTAPDSAPPVPSLANKTGEMSGDS